MSLGDELDKLRSQLQDERRTLNAVMAQCEGRAGADLAPYTATIEKRRGVIRDIEHAIAELEKQQSDDRLILSIPSMENSMLYVNNPSIALSQLDSTHIGLSAVNVEFANGSAK